MKKFMLPILLFLMFIPTVVNAETCDTDKISINNITKESKSDNVEELSQATVNGKNINLNLSMAEVGDSIEYKFIVKNDSNEDYELDNTSLNLNSDYINYSFETEDNSNIVKANSSKKVSLRVEYKTEVPEEKFENGSYNDNKTLTVQLSNDNKITETDTTISSDTTINSEVVNVPDTEVQSYILIILIMLLLSGSLYVLLKKKEYAKFMMLIIGCSLFVPIGVYAICKCEIKIDSKVEIKKQLDKFTIHFIGGYSIANTEDKQYYYESSMTIGEWEKSIYNIDNLDLGFDNFYCFNAKLLSNPDMRTAYDHLIDRNYVITNNNNNFYYIHVICD